MPVGAVTLTKQNSADAIINVSSIAASRPSVNWGLYSVFVSALDGMSKFFAPDFGGDCIRVNAVLPGMFVASLAAAFSPEQFFEAAQKTPPGRLGRPKEIGHTVLFLASDAARYVTGASLVVDGGCQDFELDR